MNKEECSLENIFQRIQEEKCSSFESRWSVLMNIKANTLDNELIKTEIENTNIQITNQLELNGNDFMYGKESQRIQIDELSQNLLKYLIDRNASLKEV